MSYEPYICKYCGKEMDMIGGDVLIFSTIPTNDKSKSYHSACHPDKKSDPHQPKSKIDE